MMTPSPMIGSLVQLIRDAIDLEYPDRPRIATLATVDDDGRPRARSIIIRRLADDGSVWFVSDGRSRKNHHLRQRPAAEVVLYLSGRREQFRISGDCRIFGDRAPDAAREQAWEMLSDAARALFFGPAPDHPLDVRSAHLIEPCPATTPIPPSFELIILRPLEVDHLQVDRVPHRRSRYREADNWQPAPINP